MNIIKCTIYYKYFPYFFLFFASMFIKILKSIKIQLIIIVFHIIDSYCKIFIQIIIKIKLFKMIFFTENNHI